MGIGSKLKKSLKHAGASAKAGAKRRLKEYQETREKERKEREELRQEVKSIERAAYKKGYRTTKVREAYRRGLEAGQGGGGIIGGLRNAAKELQQSETVQNIAGYSVGSDLLGLPQPTRPRKKTRIAPRKRVKGRTITIRVAPVRKKKSKRKSIVVDGKRYYLE